MRGRERWRESDGGRERGSEGGSFITTTGRKIQFRSLQWLGLLTLTGREGVREREKERGSCRGVREWMREWVREWDRKS